MKNHLNFRTLAFYSFFGMLVFFTYLLNILIVPILPENELSVVEGQVTHIYEAGHQDVCFRLKGHENSYYINRGLENGLSLEVLKERLLGETVTIKHPEYMMIKYAKSVHLSILRHEDETLFDETPAT